MDFKKIKTWQGVCKTKGIDPVKSLPFPKPADKDQKAVNAFYKLNIIREVFNEGWIPDWNNYDQYKYYPWFDHSGGGFSSYDCYFADTGSLVGARLVFKSREIAEHVGQQFLSIYKEFHTL